jgi:hypothetical protein
MNKEKLESAKNLFFIALGIDIAVIALVMIGDLWSAGVLKDIDAGRITADQSTISTMEFWDSFAKGMILTMIGVGLGLVKWLNTCYSYAKDAIGASGFKNEGWTTGGWIIPIFNMFKPYQVINEIYKAGNPTYAIPDGWKKQSGSGLLLTWWIFWVVTHFIGWIVGKQMLKSAIRDDMTLQQSIGMIEFHTFFCFMSLIITGLWFVVAGELTRRLLDRQCAGDGSPYPVRFETMTTQAAMPQQAHASIQTSNISPAPSQSIGSQIAGKAVRASVNPAQSPTTMSPDASTEEDCWATAMNELETGQHRPGVWAKVFAECDGDETKAKVAYLKARVQQLTDAERMRREQVARREQTERELEASLLQERIKAEAEDQQILDAITRFQNGDAPANDDVKLLANAAIRDPQVALITSRISGNNLLHWCALLGLDQEAATLLQLGANAAGSNCNGLQPFELAHNIALAAVLKAAISRGACPNCTTVMPLTSDTCTKCGAIVSDGASWGLIPVKT